MREREPEPLVTTEGAEGGGGTDGAHGRAPGDGAALAPGSRLHVLPGIGHFPWLEQPGCLRELLAEAILAATP